MDRRRSLGLLGAMLTSVVWSKAGEATTARAVSLQDSATAEALRAKFLKILK